MAAKKLNTIVHVHGPDGTRVFGPEDDVPADYAKLIRRDDVWAGNEPKSESGDAGDGIPSNKDKKDVWEAYAKDHGIEVKDGATKQEIVDAVTAAVEDES